MCKKLLFSYMNFREKKNLPSPSHTLPPFGRFARSLWPHVDKSWRRHFHWQLTKGHKCPSPPPPPPPPVDWSKRRTGPFPLGGHNIFCPNFVSLPESRICLGNAFLSHMGEGGGVFGGGEYYSFEVIVYRKPRRGVRGYPPPTVGTFLGIFGYYKARFWVGYKV